MPGPMRRNHLICSPKPIIAEQSPTAPNGGYSSACLLIQLVHRCVPDGARGCMNIHDHRASRMRASAADSAPRPLCAGETLARLWLDLPPLGLRASGRPPGAGCAGLSAEVRPRTIAGWSGPRGRRQQTRGSATWSWPRRNSRATPAGVARPRLAVRPPAPGRNR